jgi:hypothetical protein
VAEPNEINMREITLIFCLFISGLSYSQTNSPVQDNLLGEALDDYGTVAGAWYLEQHCSFLGDEEAKKFEKSVAKITTTLRSEISNPDMLLQIQEAAKEAAQKKRYSTCGGEVKELVIDSSKHAANWAEQIQQIQFGGERSAVNERIENYSKLYGAWLTEKECAVLDRKSARTFTKDLETLQAAIPGDQESQNLRVRLENGFREILENTPVSSRYCEGNGRKNITLAARLAHDWVAKLERYDINSRAGNEAAGK